MKNIGNAFALEATIQDGHYSTRGYKKKAVELNRFALAQQTYIMNSDLTFCGVSLLNAGILYPQMQITKPKKTMKPTMRMFVQRYWVPIAAKIPAYLRAYGFVPIAYRREKMKYAKDFLEMFPLDENGRTETLVPYIPVLSEISIEVQMDKGYPEFTAKFKDKENQSKRLKLYFSAHMPDFDPKSKVLLTDFYKLLPRYNQMISVERHLMANMAKQVNPGVAVRKRDMSKEEERLRSRDKDHMFPFEYFMQTHGQTSEEVTIQSQLDAEDVYDRTNDGEITTTTQNVSVLPEEYEVIRDIPQSNFPVSDIEYARNWFIVGLCSALGVPPNYFVINKSKHQSDQESDRIKLLESRQNMIHEIKMIIEQLWYDIYEEDVDLKLDMLPAVTSDQYLKYLALGLLNPHAPDVTNTFYHLSGVRVTDFNGADKEELADAYASDLKMKKLKKVDEHDN
jgi:hypothetical protein